MVGANYQLAYSLYPYKKVAAQDQPAQRHPVVVVGGGPVGIATALDLAKRGTPVLVLDDHEGVGQGSRAICFAKRTLDIADRLGAGRDMVDKGVVWNVGKVFHGQDKVFQFNLLPEDGHKNPAFINLQQPYFEKFLVDALRRAEAAGAPVEIRGRNVVTGIAPQDDHVRLEIETPDGPYAVLADYVIACDGARSPLRDMMGLRFDGRVFEDNFLIADVKMKADFPTERWFWFEPPSRAVASLRFCTNSLMTSGALISNLAGTLTAYQNWTLTAFERGSMPCCPVRLGMCRTTPWNGHQSIRFSAGG